MVRLRRSRVGRSGGASSDGANRSQHSGAVLIVLTTPNGPVENGGVLPAAGRTNPNVSVIVTGYNSAPTIIRAIESVRAQTVDDFELIFVDDASADNTVALVEGIADPRIRIVRNAKN